MILRLSVDTSSCNLISIGCTFNSASKELAGVDYNGCEIRDKTPL